MSTAARTRWSLLRPHPDGDRCGAVRRFAPLPCFALVLALGAGPAVAADPAPPPAAGAADSARPTVRPAAAATPADFDQYFGDEQLVPDPARLPEGEPRRVAQAFAKGTFWRVEKDGSVRGFVLGTLHIGEPDRLGVPEEAFRRLVEATALVVEIAPDGYSAARAEALRTLPPGVDLRALLGEQSYALAERLASAAHLDAAALARMQPWAALALLQAISHLPERSLDDVLVDRARAVGVEIVGLESIEEQFGAFNCAPLEGQALVMRETLAAHDRFREINETTVRLYRAQELEGLMSYLLNAVPLSEGAKTADDQTNRCLIDTRNQLMADRLAPLLGARVLFVAIGALHLTGADGVLARLERRGYRIVPVAPEGAAAAVD